MCVITITIYTDNNKKKVILYLKDAMYKEKSTSMSALCCNLFIHKISSGNNCCAARSEVILLCMHCLQKFRTEVSMSSNDLIAIFFTVSFQFSWLSVFFINYHFPTLIS